MGDKWMYSMEDGELLCASSMCDADGGCPNMFRCRELPEMAKDTLVMAWKSKVKEALNKCT